MDTTKLKRLESRLIDEIGDTGNVKLMNTFLAWQDERKKCNEEYIASIDKLTTTATEKQIKIINGRTFKHLDVVHHTTTTKFKFWDRIKILLGREAITQSKLYTAHEYCNIVGSEAKTFVAVLFQKRRKQGYGLLEQPENNKVN